MKKIASFLAISIFILSFSACTQSTSSSSEAKSVSSTVPEEVEKEPDWWSEEVQSLPLTKNPVTGLPFSETYEKGQRPVAIMIANDVKALPQRGLSQADLVYEMVTEAGITRLMAVYSDYKNLPEVGPVRSTRDQFIQVAIPQNYILQHIGSSIYGSNLLAVEEYKTVDGISLGDSAFKFDNDRFVSKYGHRNVEYCWFTDTGLLWNGMEKEDIYTSGEEVAVFRFSNKEATTGTNAYYIKAVFSSASNASFDYDEGTGLYNKNIFDSPHTDEDGTRLTYKNVLLLETETGLKVDGELPDFNFTGGTGYYFTAGKVILIQWHKGAVGEQLKFADMNGNMLELQPGKTYIGFVPLLEGASITYTEKVVAQEPIETVTTSEDTQAASQEEQAVAEESSAVVE